MRGMGSLCLRDPAGALSRIPPPGVEATPSTLCLEISVSPVRCDSPDFIRGSRAEEDADDRLADSRKAREMCRWPAALGVPTRTL